MFRDMTAPYLIPSQSVSTEQTIKKSRFICTIGRAETRHGALCAIESVRSEHQQATHVCWAYIAGHPDHGDRGMSDDGEPRGTAGKPMLALLAHSGLGEIWSTVTRYYGGIKLGTGGLVRAYSSSLQRTLKVLPTHERVEMSRITVSFPYRFHKDIVAIITAERGAITSEDFQQAIIMTIDVPKAEKHHLLQRLTAVSKNTIRMVPEPGH